MRDINRIIVHCSATTEKQNFNVDEIRSWHKGRGWSDIGYHYVITRRGEIQEGRSLDQAGAHAKGHNDDSIGICLVGGINSDTRKPDANYTYQQYQSLVKLVDRLELDLGRMDINGHYSYNSLKSCPCFDVKSFFDRN